MKGCVIIIVAVMVISCTATMAQETKTKKIVIVTLDGYRWNELFKGADPRLLLNPEFVKDTTVIEQFGDSSQQVSRARLMPFFWNVIGGKGQLYGNRIFNNKVNCSNGRLISYPGYSEMLVGFTDPSISSNEKKTNPNFNVLEYIHRQPGFQNKVAAFSTWDVIPYVLRAEQAGIYVNAGTNMARGSVSEMERWLNEKQTIVKNPHGSRYDAFTFRYAMEYLKRQRPRVLFISFDETDEHGHGGRYDEYLKSAHQADQMIAELWHWLQAQDDYKDQTTLLITTDHGRGSGQRSWRKHRLLAHGSRHIWFAVIGPDTPPLGEMKIAAKYYQKQFAKTAAAFLGINYQHIAPVGTTVHTMVANPDTTATPVTIIAERAASLPDENHD